MKKILFLSIFLIAIGGKSQEMTVYYTEYRKANYHQLKSIIGMFSPTLEEVDLINSKIEKNETDLSRYSYTSILKIKGNESIYHPMEKNLDDKINTYITYGNQKRVFKSRQTFEKDYAIVYMNLKSSVKISTEYIQNKAFLISENLSPLKWEITNEKKKIQGYNCKKAILRSFRRSRNAYSSDSEYGFVEVWYTEEVASKFGPLGFIGLPGLVVMVKEKNDIIILEKVTYSLDSFDIQPPNEGKPIDREELRDIPMLLFHEH